MSTLTEHDDSGRGPRGLPGKLPAGETILWQGAPVWWSLAIHAFHVRKVAIYFALLCAARMAYAVGDGDSLLRASRYILAVLPFASAAMGILSLMAWRYARTTTYTITTRRVVIRSGIALEITVNLPFARIDGAGLRVHRDGTGDLPLRLNRGDRIAVLAVWPHMRPFRFTHPQPMLRSVPNPTMVAKVLGSALAGKAVAAHQPAPALSEHGAAAGLSAAA